VTLHQSHTHVEGRTSGWNKCPGSANKRDWVEHIPLNLSYCQMSVCFGAVPHVCPYTCLSPCLGSGSPTYCCPPLISAFLSSEFKRAPYGKITVLCERYHAARKENQSSLARILLLCDIPLWYPHMYIIPSLGF
jgi:hypothetical protein